MESMQHAARLPSARRRTPRRDDERAVPLRAGHDAPRRGEVRGNVHHPFRAHELFLSESRTPTAAAADDSARPAVGPLARCRTRSAMGRSRGDSAGRPRSVASSSMFSSPSSMSTSTVVVVASSPSSATAGSSCRVARGVGPDEERLSASSEKASVATGMGAAESTVPSASERAWLVRSRRASIWRALAASLRAGKNRRGEGKPSRARASGGFRRVATPQTRCGPPRDRDSRRTFDSAAGMTLGSSPSSDAADDRS